MKTGIALTIPNFISIALMGGIFLALIALARHFTVTRKVVEAVENAAG